MTISATDGALVGSCTVTVAISDVAEAPVVGPYIFVLGENEPSDTVIIVSVALRVRYLLY